MIKILLAVLVILALIGTYVFLNYKIRKETKKPIDFLKNSPPPQKKGSRNGYN